MGLFNRPTSTSAKDGSSKENSQPNDIFSHSNSYGSILAEQERRRKEKAEKQKSRRESKRKSNEGVGESPGRESGQTSKGKQSEGSPKRRRISGHDVGGLLRKSGISNDADAEDEEEAILMEPSPEEWESPRQSRLNRRLGRNGSSSATVKNKEVIELDGSSDDETSMGHGTSQRAGRSAPVQEEEDESDEELAALAREARRRRLQPQSNSGTPDVASKASPFQSGAADSPHTDRSVPPPHDPAVKILVTSRIANTNPLIVYRKLSQNLKEIRLAYCKRQGFDEDFTQRVFLIHRMRRVYDVTTCRSLGLDTDADGNVTMKGAEGKEGVDQVALEAVTEDIFNQMRSEKAREDAKRAGQWDPEAEEEPENETPAEIPAAEELMGLVLKAKDKPDFRLKVKPTTPFSKIINACRKTFHVADGANIRLEFDGETINSEEQVQDTEMEDLDIVNVYIS